MNVDFILDYEWVVLSVIKKFSGYSDYEDLYQVGMMALIKAYNNYKESWDDNYNGNI